MKEKLIFVIVISLLSVMNMSAQKAEKVKSAKKAKTETVVYSVNISCDNCVNKIKKQLSFEKGVKDLHFSLEDKVVAVKFDPTKTDRKKVFETIKKLGYIVSEQETIEKAPKSWQ
jgi:copper chaperone CopZ